MAFTHGKDSRVLANEQHVSTEVRGWNATWKRDYADTTVLSDSGAKGTPGLTEGEFELEGFLSDGAVGSKPFYDEANGAVGTDNGLNVTVQPSGNTIGQPAIFAAIDVEDFEVESEVDDAVKITISGATHGGTDIGVIHKALSLETTSGVGHASTDNAALTANGGAGMLHVTTATGTSPQLIVKIQHSVDDSVWVDLLTFASTATPTSEFKEVAAGTTVNRYTRAFQTISGSVSPQFTYTVAFARR